MSSANGENVLVLVLDEHPDVAALRGALRGHDEASIRLLAPAHVGPLHWYATDEDEDYADAARRARETTHALAPVADTEATEGDADPVLAVEDALAEFRADRILVVGDEDAALHDSLERFELPVESLGGPPEPVPGDRLRETGRAIQSGRSDATPYAVFVGAMLVLGAFVAIGLLIAAAILWL